MDDAVLRVFEGEWGGVEEVGGDVAGGGGELDDAVLDERGWPVEGHGGVRGGVGEAVEVELGGFGGGREDGKEEEGNEEGRHCGGFGILVRNEVESGD